MSVALEPSPLSYQFAWYALGDELAGAPGFDDARPAFRCTALSLGTVVDPLFVAFVEGTKGGVTSQIGAKLAIDAMVEESVLLLERMRSRTGSAPQFIQTAFREANKQLYQYGNKMLSGGKIAAGGLLLCYDGQKVSVGRTSLYEAYLSRDGQLAQFFGKEVGTDQPAGGGAFERFLGTGKQVLVDIASLSVIKRDRIFLSSFPMSQAMLGSLSRSPASRPGDELAEEIGAIQVRSQTEKSDRGAASLQRNVYCAVLDIL